MTVTYRVTHAIVTRKCAFPVPGCVGTPRTKYVQVNVPGEGSKCKRCGMQVNPMVIGNQSSKSCIAVHAARLQRKAVSDSAVALDKKFFA